jgi:hypothetical protein
MVKDRQGAYDDNSEGKHKWRPGMTNQDDGDSRRNMNYNRTKTERLQDTKGWLNEDALNQGWLGLLP